MNLDNIIDILRIVGLVLGFYYILLLFAAAVWTYRDIRSRTQDIMAQVLSIALVLVSTTPWTYSVYADASQANAR